ncbi:hypothetical protein BDV97DRAFT_367782 [Delphinella strobiligena]|nr:hypothetical protein BDV97DRAFT_367782 [Delphinella strobiligena]
MAMHLVDYNDDIPGFGWSDESDGHLRVRETINAIPTEWPFDWTNDLNTTVNGSHPPLLFRGGWNPSVVTTQRMVPSGFIDGRMYAGLRRDLPPHLTLSPRAFVMMMYKHLTMTDTNQTSLFALFTQCPSFALDYASVYHAGNMAFRPESEGNANMTLIDTTRIRQNNFVYNIQALARLFQRAGLQRDTFTDVPEFYDVKYECLVLGILSCLSYNHLMNAGLKRIYLDHLSQPELRQRRSCISNDPQWLAGIPGTSGCRVIPLTNDLICDLCKLLLLSETDCVPSDLLVSIGGALGIKASDLNGLTLLLAQMMQVKRGTIDAWASYDETQQFYRLADKLRRVLRYLEDNPVIPLCHYI